MLKPVFIFLSSLVVSATLYAQERGSLRVALHTDLIKTDNDRFLDKMQAGAEGIYFLTPKVGGTGGLEYWSGKKWSLVLGARWYATEDVFVRVRGLIGANEMSVGGGFSKPISPVLRFEAIGDFYFSIDFAIRTGLVYTIKP
jgi:hypothetical protein